MLVVLIQDKDVHALMEKLISLEHRAIDRFAQQSPEQRHVACETARIFVYGIVEWLQDQGAKVTSALRDRDELRARVERMELSEQDVEALRAVREYIETLHEIPVSVSTPALSVLDRLLKGRGR